MHCDELQHFKRHRYCHYQALPEAHFPLYVIKDWFAEPLTGHHQAVGITAHFVEAGHVDDAADVDSAVVDAEDLLLLQTILRKSHTHCHGDRQSWRHGDGDYVERLHKNPTG